MRLAGSSGAAALQLRQAVTDDGGEALLRLLAGAAGAVAAADLLAVAVLRDHGRVVQQGEAPGADGKGVGVRKGIEGRDRYQQAEGPDCAAMGVYPPGGGEHGDLAFTTELTERGTQGLADFTEGLRGFGHLAQAGPQ